MLSASITIFDRKDTVWFCVCTVLPDPVRGSACSACSPLPPFSAAISSASTPHLPLLCLHTSHPATTRCLGAASVFSDWNSNGTSSFKAPNSILAFGRKIQKSEDKGSQSRKVRNRENHMKLSVLTTKGRGTAGDYNWPSGSSEFLSLAL